MNNEIRTILDFWFGEIGADQFCVENRGKLWFGGGEEADTLIREKFGALVEQAGEGAFDDWATVPEGRMALIILLDQFTRNVYRGEGRAFSLDPLARKLCKEGLALGHDQQLPFSMRTFFYLPLEHSEVLADQDRSVALYQAMLGEVPHARKEQVQGNVDYAESHREIIAKFGRFPHRNLALGRENTPEEVAYLNGEHNRFGQ